MRTYRGSVIKLIGDVLAVVVVTIVIAFFIYVFTTNITISVIAGVVIFILANLVLVSGDIETLTIDDNYVKMYTMTGKLEWEVDRSKVVFTYGGYSGLRAEGDGINQRVNLTSFSNRASKEIYDVLGAQEIVYKAN